MLDYLVIESIACLAMPFSVISSRFVCDGEPFGYLLLIVFKYHYFLKEGDENDTTEFTPIVVAKFGNLNFNTVSDNHQIHNQFSIQVLDKVCLIQLSDRLLQAIVPYVY